MGSSTVYGRICIHQSSLSLSLYIFYTSITWTIYIYIFSNPPKSISILLNSKVQRTRATQHAASYVMVFIVLKYVQPPSAHIKYAKNETRTFPFNSTIDTYIENQCRSTLYILLCEGTVWTDLNRCALLIRRSGKVVHRVQRNHSTTTTQPHRNFRNIYWSYYSHLGHNMYMLYVVRDRPPSINLSHSTVAQKLKPCGCWWVHFVCFICG